MLILGIDTSCDDTSASLLEIAGESVSIITNVVSSQSDIHKKYGGIVPELASRRHIEMIWPIVDEALAGKRPDIVAVSMGPGLIGSLLVGTSFAKAMCYPTGLPAKGLPAKGLPLVGVNHLEGHILSVYLNERPGSRTPVIKFPFISLIVSGGHTSLYRVEGFCKYTELGRTRDDAAGEAYDKVSKLLGLGYPGGPEIDRISKKGNPEAIPFPRAYLPGGLDFSFSGLKTAVRLTLHGDHGLKTEDVAASFQAAMVDTLVRKTEWAIRDLGIKRLSLSGGVAANSALREKMASMAVERGVELFMPPPALCTDNAAMVALAGYHRYFKGELSGLDLNPKAYLPL